MSLTINSMNNTGISLFNTSSSSSNTGLESLLGDYNTIKSGSYGKLVSSYYKKFGSDSDSTTDKTSKKSDTKTSDLKSKASTLSDAADTLLARGSKSLFNKKEVKNEDGTVTTDYDKDAIYNAVSKYIDAYNDTIDSGKKADKTNMLIQTASIATLSNSNAKMLGQVGITIGSDSHLSINESYFKENADMNTVKDLFNNNGGYAYQISSKASMLKTYATNELSSDNTYTKNAMLSNSDIISSFKQNI